MGVCSAPLLVTSGVKSYFLEAVLPVCISDAVCTKHTSLNLSHPQIYNLIIVLICDRISFCVPKCILRPACRMQEPFRYQLHDLLIRPHLQQPELKSITADSTAARSPFIPNQLSCPRCCCSTRWPRAGGIQRINIKKRGETINPEINLKYLILKSIQKSKLSQFWVFLF